MSKQGVFVTELDRLRKNMILVINTYSAHAGQTPLASIVKVLTTRTASNVYTGADFYAGRYDQWVQRFSDVWPDDLAWPEGVARPPKRTPAGGAA